MISNALAQTDANAACASRAVGPETGVLAMLQRTFGTPFALLDTKTGEEVAAGDSQRVRDLARWSEVCRQVAQRGRPEFIAEEGPVLVLALPTLCSEDDSLVAVGAFVIRPVSADDDLSQAASLLGMEPEEAIVWAQRQTVWAPQSLECVSDLAAVHWQSTQRIKELAEEADGLSVQLANTYEEISLLHRLTQNLRISKRDEDLGQAALQWMAEVIPAQGLAIQLLHALPDDQRAVHDARRFAQFLTEGNCPVNQDEFSRLIGRFGPSGACRPFVVNRPRTEEPDWVCPKVRQMIAVSLTEGEHLFGWLAVFNHVEDGEFGTVEASLLNSVAVILGIHRGNVELYRQQSGLLAGIIRALTSAIDAKDPYTCGHSDRVARIAVRLAKELGCDPKTVDTIYLSGLLHDIGKIGVDDSVLRKPERLSDSEYEHIKRHVEIGHRILLDLGKLGDVLPVILHHHESWDGRGYPHQLESERIPLAARIVAVADAFDAMGSDRPYRKGMPDEKIDAIFRDGSGTQWDPRVVEAFFRVRDDLRCIANNMKGKSADARPAEATPLPFDLDERLNFTRAVEAGNQHLR